MKVINIEQPYASLICTGIQDILDVKDPIQYRGEILICAKGGTLDYSVLEKSMPRQQYRHLDNGWTFGYISCDREDSTQNKIVGIVTIADCVKNEDVTDTIWHTGGTYTLKLTNPLVFDKPLNLGCDDAQLRECERWNEAYLKDAICMPKLGGKLIDDTYYIEVLDKDIDGWYDYTEDDNWLSIHLTESFDFDRTKYTNEVLEKKLLYLEFRSDKRKLRIPLEECKPLDYDDLDVGENHDGDEEYLTMDFTWFCYQEDLHIVNLSNAKEPQESPTIVVSKPHIPPKHVFLTWDPNQSEFKNSDYEYTKRKMIENPGSALGTWNVKDACCVRKDYIFSLLRVGKDNPGIVWSGSILSDPYESLGWADQNKKMWYVKVLIDLHASAKKDPLVTLSMLKELAPEIDWDNIESCTILPEDVHDKIINELAKDFDVVKFLREYSISQ